MYIIYGFLYCIVWAILYTASIWCCVSKLCTVDLSLALCLHYCQCSVPCVLLLYCISATASAVCSMHYSLVLCVCITVSAVCCAYESCIVFALLPVQCTVRVSPVLFALLPAQCDVHVSSVLCLPNVLPAQFTVWRLQ